MQRRLRRRGGQRGQGRRGSQQRGRVAAGEPEELVQVPLDEAQPVSIVGGPRVEPHRPCPGTEDGGQVARR